MVASAFSQALFVKRKWNSAAPLKGGKAFGVALAAKGKPVWLSGVLERMDYFAAIA